MRRISFDHGNGIHQFIFIYTFTLREKTHLGFFRVEVFFSMLSLLPCIWISWALATELPNMFTSTKLKTALHLPHVCPMVAHKDGSPLLVFWGSGVYSMYVHYSTSSLYFEPFPHPHHLHLFCNLSFTLLGQLHSPLKVNYNSRYKRLWNLFSNLCAVLFSLPFAILFQ